MHEKRCPLCGTNGKIWNEDPVVFVCPNCSSFYSQFGFVLESEKESQDLWN